MRYPNACILLFTRVPEVGKVKTRLIEALGATGACALHETLLQQKLQLLQQQQLCAAEVWLAEPGRHALLDVCELPTLIQQGRDLGERMQHAAAAALQRYQQVVLIGTDCPALDTVYLQQALASLEQGRQVVLGPALDGGYVLIGLIGDFPGLFEAVEWGTDKVLRQTLCKIKEAGLSADLLLPLADIDRPEDLQFLQRTE